MSDVIPMAWLLPACFVRFCLDLIEAACASLAPKS